MALIITTCECRIIFYPFCTNQKLHFIFHTKMDGARAQFLEGVVELHEAWELACELGGNSDELTARRDELAEKVGEMTRGEELLREKISEKQDERTQIEEDIEKFNEIKGVLEETCERLGLENEELLAIKAKIDEEYVFS